MKKDTITIPVEVYDDNDPLLPQEFRALVEEAKRISKCSYAPYSQFHVGAALRLADGTVVTGSNQENAAFPATCCAERTALYYAGANYPNVPVTAIAIAAWREKDDSFLDCPVSPCGTCRQHLLETEVRFGQSIKVILYGRKAVYVLNSARDLLPISFTKEEL